MTLEETIREKQRFKKSVIEFLSIATALTNQELEIALARIADWMNTMSDEQSRIQWRFRGQLLKSYYDLRLAGKKRVAMLKRIKGKWDNSLTFRWKSIPDEEHFICWLLEHPIMFPETESELNQWADTSFTEDAKT
jgi:hypothetical protein